MERQCNEPESGEVAEASGVVRARPVRTRELLAVAGLIALADVTIYRGQGFAGLAALYGVGSTLLLWGMPERQSRFSSWIIGAMLLPLMAAMLWCGGWGQVAIGAILVVAFAMTLVGMAPYAGDVAMHAALAIATGCAGLIQYLRSLNRVAALVPRATWLKVLLPLAAVLGFGTLFVFANPDEAQAIGQWLSRTWHAVWETFVAFSPTGPEYLLWVAVAWIAAGLLRPLLRRSVTGLVAEGVATGQQVTVRDETPYYTALRNTLLAVILLFAAYLAFEFKTLWFRVFPKGFYYSGYAHEGAAWLTAVLALSTFVLSAIFRASILNDSRLPRLRRLAWIWSVENLLLAVAVYHRMQIYVRFNGMTRMRVVGLLGITAVLVGFILVVRKIAAGRNFVWLVNRQLWTLAVVVYLYFVIPVDALVHTYNVRRILAGDPAPSVQISVHPIDTGGVLVLKPLVNCNDEYIREGVRAMLAERALRFEDARRTSPAKNWTGFQAADRLLAKWLVENPAAWNDYTGADKRQVALQRFHDYSYQWY